MTSRDRVSLLESVSVEGYSPPPSPSERLAWRGSCKKCLQNLEGQGVRGQNLDNKAVRRLSKGLTCTASALTMICLIWLWGQGQMSQRAVEMIADGGDTTETPARSRKISCY